MRRIQAVIAALAAGVAALTLTALPTAEAVTTTPVVWLCKPGLASNPCEIPLDTTRFRADGSSYLTREARLPSAQRRVDCFYVYPTVSNQPPPNATKAKDPEIISIAKYQAARFSRACRMYAPVYRQVPLAGIPTGPLGVPTAYADVKQAFLEYLNRHSNGRGFVLIGHSQGSLMLRKLVRELIDTNPALRKRLISALLMGGNVTVAKGRHVGGDFQNVPLCRAKGQTRCVVAYSTYSTDPTPVSFFGNSITDVSSALIGHRSGLGYEIGCTDPALLSGTTAPAGVTIPTEPFAPGPIQFGILLTGGVTPKAPTTWVQPADRVQGRCRTINGATVYRYSPLPGSRQLNEFPATWGTHLVDINLGLDRLVHIAIIQSRAWLAAR